MSVKKTTAPVRLWVKGVFTGYRRNKRSTNHSQAILRIDGVEEKTSAQWYNGKKVAYLYKARNTKRNTKYRVIWGTIRKPHGNNGAVTATFRRNLPPKAMGELVRIMLYPHRFQK